MSAPTIGSVGIGSSLAGGIINAFGAFGQGQSQSKMYAYQAQVAQINSQIDKQNADYARQVGDRNQLNYGLRFGQQEAQIRTAKAASGLDINSGSAADVQSSQRKLDQMDLSTMRENAAKTAYDYDVKATQDMNQAGLYNAASSNASRAGIISGLGSLIGTAGSVSSKWLAGSTSGLFNSGGSGVAGSGITLYGPDMNITGYTA